MILYIHIFIKIEIKVCIFDDESILRMYTRYSQSKNSPILKIFLWKKRRFRLRWDSSPQRILSDTRLVVLR